MNDYYMPIDVANEFAKILNKNVQAKLSNRTIADFNGFLSKYNPSIRAMITCDGITVIDSLNTSLAKKIETDINDQLPRGLRGSVTRVEIIKQLDRFEDLVRFLIYYPGLPCKYGAFEIDTQHSWGDLGDDIRIIARKITERFYVFKG